MPKVGRIKPVKKAWRVDVVRTATGEVVDSIECTSENSAERVERGVLINMNREEFHTDIKGPKA